jgi:hypothetical protein
VHSGFDGHQCRLAFDMPANKRLQPTALVVVSRACQVQYAGWSDSRMFRCALFVVATLVLLSAACVQLGQDLPAPPAIRTDPPSPPGTADISNRAFSKPLSVAGGIRHFRRRYAHPRLLRLHSCGWGRRRFLGDRGHPR